jgi:autoinducer 2-degrading protein
MYVVCVRVRVKPERGEEFAAAILENARGTRQEPGNVRFDVLREEADPTRFFLYEVYRSPEDFAAHQKTPHYLAWRERVADWMAEPRVGVKHTSLFPADPDWTSGG